jgi:hypothetical protein
VGGELEVVQQRHMRQTCVNTIVRYELHAGIPNQNGKTKVLICVPNYAFVGHFRSKLANL